MTNKLLPVVSTLATLELHFAAGSANGVWYRNANANAKNRKKLHALLMRDTKNKAPNADAWVFVPIRQGGFAQPVLEDFNEVGANGVEAFTPPHVPRSRS